MFSSVRKSYVGWFNITVALSCDWNGWGGGGGGVLGIGLENF